MENGKRISLLSVIIALLLMGILIVLIWIGILFMNSNKKDDNATPIVAVQNETNAVEDGQNQETTSLAEKNLNELVYDAEYDKESDAQTYTAYKQEYQSGDLWETDYDNPLTVKISDVQYPYINIDSEDAEKTNEEIKNLYKEYEKEYKELENFLSDDGTLHLGEINRRISNIFYV